MNIATLPALDARPEAETARLDTLRSLRVLDTAADPVLDGLVRTAARIVRMPIAMISLVDDERQWFKARVGLATTQTPRHIAFCAHAILNHEPFIVPDAAVDPRFADNPLVTGEPHVRFYAGIPLLVDQQAIGTLCVIDHQPRELDGETLAILTDLAHAVEHWMISWRAHELLGQRELELRQLAERVPAIVYRASVESPHTLSYVSPRVEQVGATPAQWISDPDAKSRVMHPDDRERVMVETAMSLAFGDHVQVGYRMRDIDGRWRQYYDVAHVIRLGNGHTPYLQGVILDITERIAAESSAREAEAYWRNLFSQIPEGVLVLSTTQQIVDANPQAAEMLGYSVDELKALTLSDLADAPFPALAEEAQRVFAGDTLIVERTYRHRDGRLLTIEVRASAPVDNRYVKVLRDVTQQRAQDALLRKLFEAVEQTSESIFISDLDGTIEYVNAAAAAISGYDREELVGQNSRILQSGATPPEQHQQMWASLTTGKPWKGLLHNKTKGGVDYIEHATIRPIQAVDGSFTHYLAVKENVTEKQRMRDELEMHRHHLEALVEQRTVELERAKRAAIAANEAKSAFLAAMSHEIRTPMNGVVGIIDVLGQSSLTPYQADLTGTIRESAFALLRIIDDILDFSKIEAKHLKLEPEAINLRHIIEQVCVGLQAVATARSVALQLYVDPRLPPRIVSDGVRLRQILNNLIGNAIKFSSGLERQGHVRVTAMADGDRRLQLQIIDNGIGILPEARQRIFEPFVQGESTTTRRYGGTGLGLTICYRLVEMFGGNISLTSTPDIGSTFTVELPLEATAADPLASPPRDLSGIHCHLVLSEAQLTQDWCAYLTAAGASASGPREPGTLEWPTAPSAGSTSVIITDTPDTLKALDSTGNGQGHHWNVVSLEEGQRRNPRLHKPGMVSLDSPVLLRDSLLLAVAMSVGRAAPALEQLTAALPIRNGGPLSIEEAAAQGRLILVAEDNEINQKVIQRQLALLGLAAEIVDNGIDALNRWRSGRYAMLLTDLHMPGMDGYELTRSIRREDTQGRHAPIIAVSATTLRGEAQRCRDAGMDDYVSKPVQLEQLAQVLARWIPGSVAAAKPAPSAVATATAVPPEEPIFFDPTVLPKLVGDDPTMLAEFKNDYLRSARRAAAELRAAVAASDWDTAGNVAHRLKSSSRAVGVLGLGACCERIEFAVHANNILPIPDMTSELVTLLALTETAFVTDTGATTTDAPSAATQWVVVVDDEPFQSKVLKRQLAVLGVEHVHVCDSGASALQWLQGRNTAPLLLLIDLNMPEMDGVELMRHLAERQFAGTLALVSGANERVLETAAKLAEAYQLRVLSHLHKPVAPEALNAAIVRWRNGSITGQAPRNRKMHSVAEVRHAIESDQILPYFQPKVALANGALTGVEALARWQHPSEGLLGADAFIDIAESHGMIDALTQCVLRKALLQLKAWRDTGLSLRVAVNVSMQNLAQLSFPDYVIGEIARYGLTPHDLMLEVTESQLLRDARVPMDILTRLRLKGIGLSIDDFGTGHSSLSQLRDLPFDELKIDRGFVRGSHDHPTPRAIFHGSLNMAHQLDMIAVAEGVENRADWDFVRAAGCDIAQGYFVAKPMAGEALAAWHMEWMQRFKELQ